MCFFSSQNFGTESGEVTGIFQHLKIQYYSSSNNSKHLKVSFIQIVNAVHLNMRPYLRIAKMATLIGQRNFNPTPYDTHLGLVASIMAPSRINSWPLQFHEIPKNQSERIFIPRNRKSTKRPNLFLAQPFGEKNRLVERS